MDTLRRTATDTRTPRGRTSHKATAAVAAAAMGFGLFPAVAAGDSVSALAAGDSTLEYDAEPGVGRKYVLTVAGDSTTVVAESGWTTETSWVAPEGLVDAGVSYDGYVLTDPVLAGGEDRIPRVDGDGNVVDPYLSRAPVALETTIAEGPVRVQVDAEGSESSLAANGLRARFWPHFTDVADDAGEDDGSPHVLADGAMPMASPQWGIAPTVTDGDRKFWIIRSVPDMDRIPGSPDDPFTAMGNSMSLGFEVMGWAVVEFGRELGLNIGYAGCEAASWLGNKLFGTNEINCGDDLNRDPELDFDMVLDVEYLDDGGHVQFNTTGNAVESAGEYVVGASTSTGDGFEHDWSEEMVGNFSLLSTYSTKMLGYLEIDPDHPLVEDDGTVELTFGVKGPAGAQAYLHDVGATDVLPGERVTLGGDEALAAEPVSASASAATWTIDPNEFKQRINESVEARDARLYRDGVGRFDTEINQLAAELGAEILDAPAMSEPDFGDPVRFDAGEPYPLTMLAWSAYAPGTVGLYYETNGGYEPVPLEWLTPATSGTTGFNDPALADEQLELLDDTIDYALSADASRLVELTGDGLSTARVLANMDIDRADPITLNGARLGTITYDDIGSEDQYPNHVGLDKRVDINGDGTTVVASADTLDGALDPDVVVASIAHSGMVFDGDNATVISLAGVLADAGADPFRTQDGTLVSRHVVMTVDGDHIAVSEIGLSDAEWNNHRALPANTDSRIMLFANTANGWTLQADLQPTDTVELADDVVATTVDAAHLWVAVDNSTAVLQLDASTGAVLATIDTAITPTALVTNGTELIAIDDHGATAIVDVATASVVNTFQLNGVAAPSDAALIGDELFVANRGDGTAEVPLVARFDTNTGDHIGEFGGRAHDHTRDGHGPGIVVDDKRRVFVSNPAGNDVRRYDPNNGSVQVQSYPATFTIAGLAFDGTDILVTYADVVSYEWSDHHPRPGTWYRTHPADRLDPDTMKAGVPVGMWSTTPYTTIEAFTADPLSSTAYAVMRIDDSPDGVRLVVIDTSETYGDIVDESMRPDLDTTPNDAGGSIAYEVDLGGNPRVASVDLVDGQAWIGAGTTLTSKHPMPESRTHVEGRWRAFQVGMVPDVFGASLDIAPSNDGVRVATTSKGGIAVYEFDGDHSRKSLATRTFSTTMRFHQSTLALSDDGSVLFHSESGPVESGVPAEPGRLYGYRDMGDHWHEEFAIVAPYDETGTLGRPFGGKIEVNGRVLTITGRSYSEEPAPVWMFRDPYGDWRSLRTWNPLDHPAGVLEGAGGTGDLVNAAGGRFWSRPLALVGHRPPTELANGSLLHERATEPVEAALRYTRFS